MQAPLSNTAPPPQPFRFLGGGPSPWARAAQPQYSRQAQYAPPQPGGGLGSFPRNAGTTAAGVAGGAFLFEGLSGLFGGHGGYGGGFGGGDNYDDGGGYDDGGSGDY